ncbi:glycosyltransferase family 4 protein [Schleiferiaceae bacterium]|nr:glycosyltransferase family 4 protein [Schleiferiaceae bacterium]
MKLVYIHQYFIFPEEGGASRSYWFVKGLVKAGFNVLVISTTHEKCTRDSGRYQLENFEIVYLRVDYSNSMNKISKIISFIKFMFSSTYILLKTKNIDLVFSTSTPLTVGFPALILKIVKKIPFIFEVRDLWPDFPIEIGAIKNRFIIKILRIFEKIIYRKASHIIALSPGMKEGVISHGISANKVTVIPNMSKPDLFYPKPRKAEVLERYRYLGKAFTAVHFGAMGRANGLDYLIQAALILRKRRISNIQIVFVGEGSEELRLKSIVEHQGLNNVFFQGHMNTEQIAEFVNCCEVSIVSFLNFPILATNSPNKLFDSLAAGKPVIVNSNGWTRSLLERFRCGYYVDPEHPSELVDKLIKLRDDKNLMEGMGENSRSLALAEFDKEKLVDIFISIVSSVDSYKNRTGN